MWSVKKNIDIKLKSGAKLYLPFQFPGFWGAGVCRLKVFVKNERIVFLCSQLIDYHGTSITNAVEVIKEAAIEKLLQDGILTITIPLGFFEKLTKSKQEVLKEKRLAAVEYVNNNSLWIEHYPPSDVATSESYSTVSFSDNGEPSWSYLSKEMIANQFGDIDLSVPIEDLKNWQR